MSAHDHHIRVKGRWAYFRGRKFSCSIGRGGIGSNKREGDGLTPLGKYSLLGLLLRPDRIDPSLYPSARRIRRFDVWSDDPADPKYNQLVSMGHPYQWSHERLWRSDHLYDLIIPVAFNWPSPIPGAGSAIFIHTWRNPRWPTEGCVAFDKQDLMWIAERISHHTLLVINQGCSI